MTDKSRIHGLCDFCIQQIDWTAAEAIVPVNGGFYFDEILSCCIYGFYPRQIIFAIKLQGKTYAAKGIGKLMGERAAASGKHYDMLVPVPTARKKLRKRGFNQAALLARYAAEELGIPCVEDLLTKPEDTASMRGSSGADRRQMLQNAFAVTGSTALGKRILLVDDVVTTGSTANECARALAASGAESIDVLCFACASGYGII